MNEWLESNAVLSPFEEVLFEEIYKNARQHIAGWQEEDLKMKFISFVLRLGHLQDSGKFNTYFEKTLSATVGKHPLKTKTDFMIAKGILDMPQKPYFCEVVGKQWGFVIMDKKAYYDNDIENW